MGKNKLMLLHKHIGDQGKESNLQNILGSIALALCAFLVDGAEGRILTYILTFTCQSSIPNVNSLFSKLLESYC